jgi:hypothetical protein
MDSIRNSNKHPRSRGIVKAGAVALSALAWALPTSTAFAQDLEGFDDGGVAIRSAPHSGVQLLRSLYFRFQNGDHHFGAIGVTPDHPGFGQSELIFSDINSDDDYYFHVQYQDVNPSGIFLGAFGREVCRRTCTFPIARPAGDYVFVLRGFYFYFQGSDHHLQHFGIYEQNGNLTAWLNDNHSTDNDDNFIYEVQYAYVPRSRFTSLGNVEGWGVRGADSKPIPGGISVIRGFDIAFTSSDHHIEEFGLFQWGGGSVDAYFNDNNDDDPFNWAVDWGIMN